jgi:hypothetical protein
MFDQSISLSFAKNEQQQHRRDDGSGRWQVARRSLEGHDINAAVASCRLRSPASTLTSSIWHAEQATLLSLQLAGTNMYHRSANACSREVRQLLCQNMLV